MRHACVMDAVEASMPSRRKPFTGTGACERDGGAVRRALALAALATLWAGGPAGAEPLSDGWWVVVGSSPAPGSQWTARDDAFLARVTAAMEPCGVEAFNDWSSKFEGLAPELHVAVVGAFATRAEAEAARAEVLACVPDAYLRRARYLGE